MATKRLTEKAVERIGPPLIGREEYFDATLPGFGLRVSDRGTKSWIVFYRVPSGRQRRLTLGRYPALRLAEAREKARLTLQQVERGEDPADYKPKRRSNKARTFGDIAEKYIDRECRKLKRGTEAESVIRRQLLPHWEKLELTDIHKSDARDLIEELLDDEKPAAAYRLYETIKRVFNWAFEYYDERELPIDASPVANLKPPVKKIERGRTLTASEIRAVWMGAEAAGYPFGPMVKLLLLTGQRRAEVAGLSRDEIDLEKRTWTIPAVRSKNDLPHVVPLSDQALEIVKGLPEFKAPYLLTTTGGRRPVSGFSKMKARLDAKIAGLHEAKKVDVIPGDWRLHDLRRTCRTGLAELQTPEIVAERVLNHVSGKLVRTYNVYEYADEKRRALQAWASRLESIVSPDDGDANVVPMRG